MLYQIIVKDSIKKLEETVSYARNDYAGVPVGRPFSFDEYGIIYWAQAVYYPRPEEGEK